MSTNRTACPIPSSVSERSMRTGFVAMLAAVLVAVISVSTLPAPVSAAEIADPITNVSIREDEVDLSDVVTVDLEFDIPDDSSADDFFTFTVPPRLTIRQDLTFPVLEPDTDEVVATASVSGNVVTFVLTDYVETRTDVTGDAFFSAFLNQDEVEPDTTNEITFETDNGEFPDTIAVGPSVDGADPNKFLNAATGPDGERLRTGISTGIISASAEGGDLSITDTTDGNVEIVCSSVVVELNDIVDGEPVLVRELDGAEYAADCTATGWDMSLTVAADYVDRSLRVAAWVNVVNEVDVYENSGEVTIDTETTGVEARERFSTGGGQAVGVTTTTMPTDDTTTTPSDDDDDTTSVPDSTTPDSEVPSTETSAPTTTLVPTTQLPDTGSSSTPLALAALAALLLGVGAMVIARRPTVN